MTAVCSSGCFYVLPRRLGDNVVCYRGRQDVLKRRSAQRNGRPALAVEAAHVRLYVYWPEIGDAQRTEPCVVVAEHKIILLLNGTHRAFVRRPLRCSLDGGEPHGAPLFERHVCVRDRHALAPLLLGNPRIPRGFRFLLSFAVKILPLALPVLGHADVNLYLDAPIVPYFLCHDLPPSKYAVILHARRCHKW